MLAESVAAGSINQYTYTKCIYIYFLLICSDKLYIKVSTLKDESFWLMKIDSEHILGEKNPLKHMGNISMMQYPASNRISSGSLNSGDESWLGLFKKSSDLKKRKKTEYIKGYCLVLKTYVFLLYFTGKHVFFLLFCFSFFFCSFVLYDLQWVYVLKLWTTVVCILLN